jgi:hypothetical protein
MRVIDFKDTKKVKNKDSKQDLISGGLKGEKVVCPHLYQEVKRIKNQLLQVCGNKRCQRQLFVGKISLKGTLPR